MILQQPCHIQQIHLQLWRHHPVLQSIRFGRIHGQRIQLLRLIRSSRSLIDQSKTSFVITASCETWSANSTCTIMANGKKQWYDFTYSNRGRGQMWIRPITGRRKHQWNFISLKHYFSTNYIAAHLCSLYKSLSFFFFFFNLISLCMYYSLLTVHYGVITWIINL